MPRTRRSGRVPDRVVSGVTPQGKLDTIRSLQAEGRVVAMVGDGVNDAAALTAAEPCLRLAGTAPSARR